MIWPILMLLRLEGWFRRLPRRLRIPLWLNDAFALVKYLNVVGWVTTFVYSSFYPRHFYRRMGGVVTRVSAERGCYPHLLRPIPYLIAFVALLNLLRFLGVPIFAEAGEFSVLQFNFEVLSFTLLTPLLAVIVMAALLALVGLLKFFAQGLDAISTNENKLGDAIRINWWFFRVMVRKPFWLRYRYGELIPALLYYSINAFILVPTTYVAFTWGGDFVIDVMPELKREMFAMLMNALIAVVLTILAIVLVYGLILRPLFYAVFFRSQSWLARKGVCPDLLDLFGEPEEDLSLSPQASGQGLLARTAYVDIELERSEPDIAFLRWTRVTDAQHRFVQDDLRLVDREEGLSGP